MLHGNWQSASTFEIKTRFLQEPLREAILKTLSANNEPYAPSSIEFVYPNAILPPRVPNTHDPFVLEAQESDIEFTQHTESLDEESKISQWTWAYDNQGKGDIRGFKESIQYVLEILHEQGPFIGVIGFSMGAALAALIASLLEPRRRPSNSHFNSYNIQHPPLQFAVCFSGFMLSQTQYRYLYYPKIETPILHFIGKLDPWISGSQTLKLARRCRSAKVAYFMGTHYVPRTKETVKMLVQFVTDACGGGEGESIESLESDWVDI
ncbi:unnamed protein product [Penicillium salamii]|uniref:Serine hydrolase domain-containing protein n=1 Tax=Penicillium salamii TaxID=1612424 RepID=A0A9W4JJM9_9EURO|nr:unnamed protein product [Penicillium salamii]CAG8266745.1 unnamed protein product [Penicillium salamii]CAG8362798.1 unnamed protein product [Penicillium salamii]CAG8364176.1 unnamed protein product [Penicillium salamii]CAG8390692.1 unnamed protein product [Penicillium salamii]